MLIVKVKRKDVIGKEKKEREGERKIARESGP